MFKTHTSGELTVNDVGKTVTLAGWVHRRRDHGGLTFIDLRDRYGLTQVVFNPQTAPEAHSKAHELRSEFVVTVTGEVTARPAGTENRRLPTGEIEVLAQQVEVLNVARPLPF